MLRRTHRPDASHEILPDVCQSFGIYPGMSSILIEARQAHSHPCADARDDDELALLPFEGMMSVVTASFGIAVRSIADVCVPQYQDGRRTDGSAHTATSTVTRSTRGAGVLPLALAIRAALPKQKPAKALA